MTLKKLYSKWIFIKIDIKSENKKNIKIYGHHTKFLKLNDFATSCSWLLILSTNGLQARFWFTSIDSQT